MYSCWQGRFCKKKVLNQYKQIDGRIIIKGKHYEYKKAKLFDEIKSQMVSKICGLSGKEAKRIPSESKIRKSNHPNRFTGERMTIEEFLNGG